MYRAIRILAKSCPFWMCIFLLWGIAGCNSPSSTASPAATFFETATFTPIPQLPASPTPQFIPSNMVNIEGQQRFLFGANYPWHSYGHDFGENAWGHDGVSTQLGVIDSDFASLAEMGIKVVRWFIFADGTASPDFNEDGSVSGLDDQFFADLDSALEIAQSHNIRLILVLLDYRWFAQPQVVNGVTLGGHADVAEDPAKAKTFYEQALLPLLKRYGQNPYILAWEVINEPEWAIDSPDIHSDQPIERIPLEVMQSFVRDTVDEIHSQDVSQWVTVGSASRRWWGFWEHMGLDLCQVHYYDWMEKDTPLDFPYAGLGTNLPCIVGEIPSAASAFTLDDYYRTILQNGYAGVFPWSLRAEDASSDLLENIPSIQSWAQRLAYYIEIKTPKGWIPPTPLPTQTPPPLPTPTITPDPNLLPDISQYGFEVREGEWTFQTFEDSQAVVSVQRVYAPKPVYSGQYALRLDVNLVVGEAHLSKGEALVDVLQHPPLDNSVGPYDLETGVITCWVYLPVGAHKEAQTSWITFQVFAKDTEFRSEYGTWTRIQVYDEGNWVRISLKPRRYPPKNGFMDLDFNPNEIVMIGVKIGTDDYYAKLGVSYNGPVYIDACDWK